MLTLVGIGAQDGGKRAEGEAQHMGAFVLPVPFICEIMLSGYVVFCRIQLAKNVSAQSHPRTTVVLKGSYWVRSLAYMG